MKVELSEGNFITVLLPKKWRPPLENKRNVLIVRDIFLKELSIEAAEGGEKTEHKGVFASKLFQNTLGLLDVRSSLPT